MNYENFEMNYEKLIFQVGFASSENHRHTTTSDVQAELNSFLNISRFSLPRIFVEIFDNIDRALKIVNQTYSQKNYALDDIYIFNIEDKEYFDIVELINNFLIPMSIKYLISSNVSDECFEEYIVPSIIAAEAKVITSAEKIIQGDTIKINSSSYTFTHFPLKERSKGIHELMNLDDAKAKHKLKDRNIQKKHRQAPTRPEDMVLNKIE